MVNKDEFTIKNLKEIKTSLNELIASRVIYLNAPTTTQNERQYTVNKLDEDYKLLEKVIEMIKAEETKQ